MSCEDCGIEFNEETRSWLVYTLCHVCETNDWWDTCEHIRDDMQLAVKTGSNQDAIATDLAHLVQINKNLGSRKYSGRSSNRKGRVDEKPTNRECDTCGYHLPNNFERWKTKCYRCYKLFKEGALAISPKDSESKVEEKRTEVRSTQNTSDVGDNWILVTHRRKVRHLNKIHLQQEEERAVKEQLTEQLYRADASSI